MRGAAPFALLVLLAGLVVLSCGDGVDLSYELQIVNDSSYDVERVGLGYTGIRSRAFMPPEFQIAASVPAGQMKTVELTLEPTTAYYILFICDDTLTKDIIWAESTGGYEYVLLTHGGSSTCTVEDLQTSCVAGEKAATPYVYHWAP